MAGESISFDIKKLRAGEFNPATGAAVALQDISVYQDTLDLVDTDETVTPIYAYGVKSPKRNLRGGDSIEEVVFNVLDVSAASLKFWMGGDITTVDNVDTWNKPKTAAGEVIRFIEATTADGAVIVIPRGSVTAKKDFKARKNDVFVINVKVVPTDTGLPLIPDFKMTDPDLG